MASFVSFPALGADFSISGFGTLGYARSDQPYNYQRFIDDSGTFKRDSVAGIQMDAQFADRFGATMQVKACPRHRQRPWIRGHHCLGFFVLPSEQ